MKELVLKDWLKNLTFKEQTVLLCILRGTDSGGSDEIKSWIRLIRRTVLKNAAPNKTFMRKEDVSRFLYIEKHNPLILDMLPVHFLSHLMHAVEIIGYKHPDNDTRDFFWLAYRDLCDYMHINPETREQMNNRLNDEL